METKLRNLIVILIGFVLCYGCKKDSTEGPKSDFKADILIRKLVCYPNDSVSISFEISPKEGNGPYSYQWILPDSLNGNGPFTFCLVKDLKISVIIKDANHKQLDFSYLVRKDTIDFMRYDYRNNFIGDYVCDADHFWYQLVNSEWKIIHNIDRDTITVQKSQLFSNLFCIYELKYQSARNIFSSSWGNGESAQIHFINDSLYYNYFRQSGHWVVINGKKLNNWN